METIWTKWRNGTSNAEDLRVGARSLPRRCHRHLGRLAETYSKDVPVPAPARSITVRGRVSQCRADRVAASQPAAQYRALVEQLPAVVFMAYMDRGVGEAYVSPQIEASLGFSQAEWLEDPVLWYRQVHPDDKDRWSTEAAEMFISGKPLRSAYRVMARDGRVIWFHCDAKMIRLSGRATVVYPWRRLRHLRSEADRGRITR